MLLIVESKYGIMQCNTTGKPITFDDISYACNLCCKDESRCFALWDDEMLNKIGSYSPTLSGMYYLTRKIAELQ